MNRRFPGEPAIDIPRKTRRWPARLKSLLLLTGVLLALAAGLSGLQRWYVPDALALGDFVVGEVRSGSLLRDVRAPGTLVPTDLRWIAANVDGRVDSIEAEAGERVTADTVLLRLGNPTLVRNLEAARLELEVLESQAEVAEKRLVRDLLAQEALVAEYASEHENARFRLQAYQALGEGVAQLDLREWALRERQYDGRLEIESKRLAYLRELQAAEARASLAGIHQAKANLRLQEALLAGLTVRAGIEGVLLELPVEHGQQLAAGTLLARVARADAFKVELRVQEGQAKEILLGQRVTVSAGGQSAAAEVVRIDPAVQNGVVLVDARFTDSPFAGARPDLRVQGRIEIGFVEDALILPRPVFSQENSEASLFVLDSEARQARRTAVSLGLASVDAIVVTAGLQEGDRVIVSDTTPHAERDSLPLKP